MMDLAPGSNAWTPMLSELRDKPAGMGPREKHKAPAPAPAPGRQGDLGPTSAEFSSSKYSPQDFRWIPCLPRASVATPGDLGEAFFFLESLNLFSPGSLRGEGRPWPFEPQISPDGSEEGWRSFVGGRTGGLLEESDFLSEFSSECPSSRTWMNIYVFSKILQHEGGWNGKLAPGPDFDAPLGSSVYLRLE